jgi:hypothetical protein
VRLGPYRREWVARLRAWSRCETDQANAQAIAPYDAPGPAVTVGAGSLFRLDFRARLFPADMVAIVAVRTLLANAGGEPVESQCGSTKVNTSLPAAMATYWTPPTA